MLNQPNLNSSPPTQACAADFVTDAKLRRIVRELVDAMLEAHVDLQSIGLEEMKRLLVERARHPEIDLRQLRLWIVDSIVESHVDLAKVSLEEMKRILVALARQTPGFGRRETGSAAPRFASAALIALFCCFAPDK